MKILLYNPDNGVTQNFMPHLWMFLLQSLTPPGNEVLLIDGNTQPMTDSELVQYALDQKIGLVGIGAMTRMIAKAYRVADALRAAGVPVVMGGPHVTECPDEALGRDGGPRHANAIALGEADETWPRIVGDAARPTRITIVNRTLHRLLIEAYELIGYQLKDPPELDQVRYDVMAKIPLGSTEQDVRVMMQKLLIERLELKVRHDRQVIPVYAMLIGKGGPKFKTSPEPIDPAKGGMFRSFGATIKLVAVGQTIPQLISALFRQTDHPIMDLTELTGKYDFALAFRPRTNDLSSTPPDARADDAPEIFQALSEQLGLKLEARKMPADLVIVDSGHKIPVEN